MIKIHRKAASSPSRKRSEILGIIRDDLLGKILKVRRYNGKDWIDTVTRSVDKWHQRWKDKKDGWGWANNGLYLQYGQNTGE